VKTRTIKNDLSPYWNETFHFQIAAQHVNDIRIIAMDSDIAFDDTIGSATISRADLPIRTGEETFLKVPIYSKQQVSGIVHLRVKLLNDGQTSLSTQPMYQSSSISSYPPQQMSTQSQYSSQQPPYNPQYNQPPNYNTSVTSTQQPYSQTQPSYYSQNQPYSQPPYNQNQYQGQMPPMMNQQYQNPQQQPYTYQQPPQQQYMNQQPQSNYYNKPYERPY